MLLCLDAELSKLSTKHLARDYCIVTGLVIFRNNAVIAHVRPKYRRVAGRPRGVTTPETRSRGGLLIYPAVRRAFTRSNVAIGTKANTFRLLCERIPAASAT